MDYKREAAIITAHINRIESELKEVLALIGQCRILIRDDNVPSAAIVYGELIDKLNECED